MIRGLRILVLIVLGGSGAAVAVATTPAGEPEASSGVATFANPVTAFDWPDPTIWEDRGTYYSAATGLGRVLKSEDLVNWSAAGEGPLLTPEARAAMSRIGGNFWAPDVVRIGRKWMMYVTCYNSNRDCGIVCLSSDSPSGPFGFEGLVTHSRMNSIPDTIDPEVVVDPRSGKVWLFFGSTFRIYRVELNRAGTALAARARFTHVAGVTFPESPGREKVFEGSYLYRHKGYWYLFVSAGRYNDGSYNIKVGRSRSLKGEFLDRDGRRMTAGEGTVLLSSGEGDVLYGPGHNGEIFTDKAGQDYMFYHCHSRADDAPWTRHMYLQRIFWDGEGWPYFNPSRPADQEIAPKMKK